MHRAALAAVAAVLSLAVPATAAAPPEVVNLRKQVAALNAKVKRLTAERNAARREVAALRARLTPAPIGSVSVANGEFGDRVRVTGAGVTKEGDILGQIEYLGGLSRPNLGPWLRVEATFFGPGGDIVEPKLQRDVRGARPRFRLQALGGAGAGRAD